MLNREAIHKLSEITELTFQEVRNWFRNARLRYKDPMQPTGDLRSVSLPVCLSVYLSFVFLCLFLYAHVIVNLFVQSVQGHAWNS